MKLYDFANLPSGFGELMAQSGRESFFNLPEWYRLVAQCGLESGSRAGLALDGGGRVGLPILLTRHDLILRSCTNLYTCEFAISGACVNAESIAELLGELILFAGSLDGLQFEGLDPASPSFPFLLEGIRTAGFIVKPYFGWANWFEPTHGVDFARYVSTRPSVLQNTWKRKLSSLQKSFGCDFQIYRSFEDVQPLVVVYERVHEQSWKSAEPYPAFIPGLIRLAARLGALRFGVLYLDGVPAAAQFWIVWAGKATIYKLVHAKKFADASPGTLLTMEMIRHVLERDRPSEIDFGRGNDAYKKLWLASRRERWGIEAANPRTWRGLSHSLMIGSALARDLIVQKSNAWRQATRST